MLYKNAEQSLFLRIKFDYQFSAKVQSLTKAIVSTTTSKNSSQNRSFLYKILFTQIGKFFWFFEPKFDKFFYLIFWAEIWKEEFFRAEIGKEHFLFFRVEIRKEQFWFFFEPKFENTNFFSSQKLKTTILIFLAENFNQNLEGFYIWAENSNIQIYQSL